MCPRVRYCPMHVHIPYTSGSEGMRCSLHSNLSSEQVFFSKQHVCNCCYTGPDDITVMPGAVVPLQLQKVTEELREAREKISAKSREAEEAAAKLHNCEGALQHSEMRAATLATDAEVARPCSP